MLASVDPPEVQLAQNETWHLPFRWVSDPGGERLAKPLDAWNDDASIFKPLIVAVGPDGREAFHEVSRDFTDRPDDEPILAAIEALHLDARPEPEPWRPEGVTARPSERAFQPRSFIPYFRGIRFNTTALAQRMVDDRDRAEVEQENAMAGSFLDAFDNWRKRYGEH